jgi:uncharacterized protein YndB with AHSA1/START domain
MNQASDLKIVARGDREILFSRTFNAPRNLVFDAMTKPELIKRWLGVFGGWTMAECQVDLRVGGKYRYVWHGPDNARMAMGGVFREIVPNERWVQTEKFDDPWYAGEAVGTATLVERGGKTFYSAVQVYTSKEVRDGVLKSPMESGVAKSYNALDEILATLPAGAGRTGK